MATERVVYSVNEVATILGISVASVRNHLTSGALPHLRVGKRYLIPKPVISDLIRGDLVIEPSQKNRATVRLP